MNSNIAIICDCDETLAKDTTSELLSKNNCLEGFWDNIDKNFVEKGWDPPQAYMNEILKRMIKKKIMENTKDKMKKFGETISPYSGVDEFMIELRKMISNNSNCIKAGVNLKGYIISSGIEDLIRGCKFARKEQFDDVFACNYDTDQDGKYNSIKNVITFTEKTKFLYAINKGISGKNLRKAPYLVNKPMEKANRTVPFENMIYIGDSSGDIPCFSAVQSNGGHCIGIMNKDNPRSKFNNKAYELSHGGRTNHGVYTNNFTLKSDLYLNLENIIHGITDRLL